MAIIIKNMSQLVISLSHPAIVGTVHSPASLRAACQPEGKACDWLELRIDHFFPRVSALWKAAPALPRPRIVTVRHPAEGGMAGSITPLQRRALYGDFLEAAGMVDIELRSVSSMKEVIRQAHAAGAGLILSHHDFQKTPSPEKLRLLARKAKDAGADIFKVAAMANSPRDLAVLINFLANEKSTLPLAVMGMGPFGKVSRLVLAQAGSCLTYGYLGAANASGQWPVSLLKARLGELRKAPQSSKRNRTVPVLKTGA